MTDQGEDAEARTWIDSDRGPWIQTWSGGKFYLLDPRPREIKLHDIAAALSKLPRFSGHGLRFVSVAEHSLVVYRHVQKRTVDVMQQRQAIMHDASEAYICDLSRPLKQLLPEYKKIEERIMLAIGERFDFRWPMTPLVKEADTAGMCREIQENMYPSHLAPDWPASRMTDQPLTFLTPPEAFRRFMDVATGELRLQ